MLVLSQKEVRLFRGTRNTLRATNLDLLDLAAVQTILNGGRVFALHPEQMAGGASVAAIFRY